MYGSTEWKASVPTLDQLLPEYDHRARYERFVAAPPQAAWEALQRLTLADLPLGRVLVSVRYLPARLAGRRRTELISGRLVESPPIPALAIEPGRALVLAGVRQPWRVLRPEASAPRLDAEGFAAFEDPGWAKIAMDFRIEPGPGGSRMSTETRIRATDRRARRSFAPYWLAIREPSGVIRREMLRAIALAAEERAGG